MAEPTLKVEIEREDPTYRLSDQSLREYNGHRTVISINGQRVPSDFTVEVFQRYNEDRQVRLDGARPLFDTEVYVGGVCTARVKGLLS